MPRSRKRIGLVGNVEPITGAEVNAFWREATKTGPFPSIEDCNRYAELLTQHIGHGARETLRARSNQRAVDAANLLLRRIAEILGPHERARDTLERVDPVALLLYTTPEIETLLSLRDALSEALTVFRPTAGTSAPIWESCATLCWAAARHQLQAIGRKAGETADSVAVRFAEAATRRMGFPDVKRAAIAARLKAQRVRQVAATKKN